MCICVIRDEGEAACESSSSHVWSKGKASSHHVTEHAHIYALKLAVAHVTRRSCRKGPSLSLWEHVNVALHVRHVEAAD